MNRLRFKRPAIQYTNNVTGSFTLFMISNTAACDIYSEILRVRRCLDLIRLDNLVTPEGSGMYIYNVCYHMYRSSLRVLFMN